MSVTKDLQDLSHLSGQRQEHLNVSDCKQQAPCLFTVHGMQFAGGRLIESWGERGLGGVSDDADVLQSEQQCM